MQPLLTQVPPNRLRSIIATFIPVSASRTARDGPAWPVPITIASYLVAIGIPPLGLLSSTISGFLSAVENYSRPILSRVLDATNHCGSSTKLARREKTGEEP